MKNKWKQTSADILKRTTYQSVAAQDGDRAACPLLADAAPGVVGQPRIFRQPDRGGTNSMRQLTGDRAASIARCTAIV